ncbi:hypothetical protein FHG87_005284 [Trinorchestia longiramus]|nr:hypothetical protein FHG87_005284 [Trinorchestia longiramus]
MLTCTHTTHVLTHTHTHNTPSAEEVERFLPDNRHQLPRSTREEEHVTYCPSHDARYMWNSYLLYAALDLHPAWRLCITHGFIEQVRASVHHARFD